MGDIIAGIVDMLGVYFLYVIGKYAVFIFTFGSYEVAPYVVVKGEDSEQKSNEKIISKRNTMVVGFIVLVFFIVIIAVKATPLLVSP